MYSSSLNAFKNTSQKQSCYIYCTLTYNYYYCWSTLWHFSCCCCCIVLRFIWFVRWPNDHVQQIHIISCCVIVDSLPQMHWSEIIIFQSFCVNVLAVWTITGSMKNDNLYMNPLPRILHYSQLVNQTRTLINCCMYIHNKL